MPFFFPAILCWLELLALCWIRVVKAKALTCFHVVFSLQIQGGSALYLVCWVLLWIGFWFLSDAFSTSIDPSMIFLYPLFNMAHCINGFSIIEPALHIWVISIQFIVKFDLVICWWFLCLSSWKILVCSFCLFLMLSWSGFNIKVNSGLIKSWEVFSFLREIVLKWYWLFLKCLVKFSKETIWA